MLQLALHAGAEHPSLTWIVVASVLTFAAGIAFGLWLARTTGVGTRPGVELVERE